MGKNRLKKIIFSLSSIFILVGGLFQPFFLFEEVRAAPLSMKIEIKKGWNLIGSDEIKSSFEDFKKSNPQCKISSSLWGWEKHQYTGAKIFEPYRGYMIYSQNDCIAMLSGEKGANSLKLYSGWNLISPGKKRSFNEINIDCKPKSSIYYWKSNEKKYEVISLSTPLDPAKGYWVWVESTCQIGEGVAVPGKDFECYKAQGPWTDVCEPPTILDQDTLQPKCRYPLPSCIQDAHGNYRWHCTYQEDPRPCKEAICTEKGWETIYCKEDEFREKQMEPDEIRLNLAYWLCKYLTGNLDFSIISNIGLGDIAQFLDPKIFTNIVGTETAKKIKMVAEFLVWLQEQGVTIGEIIKNAAQLNWWIDKFLQTGAKYLGDLAANEIKKYITSIFVELKVDPELAAVIGDFLSFLLKVKKFDVIKILQMNLQEFQLVLFEFINKTQSPILKYLLKLDEIIEGLAKIPKLYNDSQLFKDISAFIEFVNRYYNLTPQEIAKLDETTLKKYLDEFEKKTGIAINIAISEIKEEIQAIADNISNQIKNIFDSLMIRDLLKFIDYLRQKGINLNEVLTWSTKEFEKYYSQFRAESGIIINLSIEKLRAWVISLLQEILIQVDIKLNIGLPISDITFANLVAFIEYLVKKQNLSFNRIINLSEADLAFWKDKFEKEEKITIAIDLSNLAPYLKEIIQEIYGQSYSRLSEEDLTWADIKIIIDFINWMIENKGQTFASILNQGLDTLAQLFNQFKSIKGIRFDIEAKRLYKIVSNQISNWTIFITVQPWQKTINLFNVTISFINWLRTEKKLNFDEIIQLKADELKKLFDEFLKKTGQKIIIEAEELKSYINRLIERIREETEVVTRIVRNTSAIIDFILKKVPQLGKDPKKILDLSLALLTNYIEEYLKTVDPVVFGEIVAERIKAFLRATLRIEIDAGIFKEIGEFIAWVIRIKNIPLEKLLDMAFNNLMELIRSYIEFQIQKITNLKPQDIQLIAAILATLPDLPKIIEDLKKFDLNQILSHFISVKIAGKLDCPLLQGDVCDIFDLSKWRKPVASDLTIENGAISNDFKLFVYYGLNSRPGQYRVCTLPGIDIKFLGKNITFTFRIGPVEIEGNKLWLDMPTQCYFNAGEPNSRPILMGISSEELKRGAPYIYSPLYNNKTLTAKSSCSVWGYGPIQDFIGLTDKKTFSFTLHGESPPYQVRAVPFNSSELEYREVTFKMTRAGKVDYLMYNNGIYVHQFCTLPVEGFTTGYILKKNGVTILEKQAWYPKKPYWPLLFPTISGTLDVVPGETITIGGWGCLPAPAGGRIQFRE